MFELTVEKLTKKNLISKGYSVSFDISLLPSSPTDSLSCEQLGTFTEIFCKQLPELFPFQKTPKIPLENPEQLNSGVTTNIRGFQNSKSTFQGHPSKEIFFFATGNLANQAEQTDSEVDQLQPFFFEISSNFKNFNGRNKIIHSVTRRSSSELNSYLQFLSAASLGRLVGLKLATISVGVEIFKERFLGSYFGLAPVIEQRFCLNLSEKNVSLIIEDDRTNSPKELILEDIQLFPTLNNAFELSRIFPHFSEQLLKQLQQERL